jgi:ectoine hydroxylase-related dioxygenase (phytanoyl-CoA dioxygenase family)
MPFPRFTLEHLSEAARFYRESGFAVVEDVFREPEIHRVRRVWAEILDKRGDRGARIYRSLLQPHTHYPAILAFIKETSLLNCIRAFLGDDVRLLQTQLMFGPPGNDGFTPHQDNFTNRVEPSDAAIAAWIAMEDADTETGALKVWAGSHRQGLRKVKFDWFYLLKRSPRFLRSYLRVTLPRYFGGGEDDTGVMERYASCQIAGVFEEIVLEVPAGSVVLMHGDLIHASLPNRSHDRFRHSLLTNFIRRGARYCDGMLTGRAALDVG